MIGRTGLNFGALIWDVFLIIGRFRQIRFFLLTAAASASAKCSERRRQTIEEDCDVERAV